MEPDNVVTLPVETDLKLRLAKVVFSAIVGFAATGAAEKVFDKAVTRIKNR